MRPKPVKPGPGQESVWDYPRPPRLEPARKRIRVVVGGVTIADSNSAWRVLETSHPPVYYVPPADVRMDLMESAGGASHCEWKGGAVYYSAKVSGRRVDRIAWAYPRPTPSFAPIRDHLAFYAALADKCFVDDERVTPQPGGFYGGWITADVVGPFKGEPDTWGW